MAPKRNVWPYVLISLCVLSFALCVVFTLFWPSNSHDYAYIPRDYKGKLAVYEMDGAQPLEVYEVYTHLLPESDVLHLQKGIPVETEEELHRLLEDFGW